MPFKHYGSRKVKDNKQESSKGTAKTAKTAAFPKEHKPQSMKRLMHMQTAGPPCLLSFPSVSTAGIFAAVMNDILQNILPSLVSLLIGGGLTAVITARSVRQKAKADAMMSVQDVYQETITDLRQDRLSQREEFERQITDLKTRIESLQADVENLKKLKCYNLECPKRIRHN